MNPAPSFADLAASRYVRLTTFRSNGEPVPTPVWITRRGETLIVVTEARSGKVKRLRNDSRVVVAPSDWRGNPKGGQIQGTASVLDGDSDTVAEQTELARAKYGWEYKILRVVEKLRRAGDHDRIALAITLDPAPTPSS